MRRARSPVVPGRHRLCIGCFLWASAFQGVEDPFLRPCPADAM